MAINKMDGFMMSSVTSYTFRAFCPRLPKNRIKHMFLCQNFHAAHNEMVFSTDTDVTKAGAALPGTAVITGLNLMGVD